ncbi:mycofactocin-coupled SDR family oxidoreductase [Pseudonocardia abyssalis]|uniref:Mycofactocin-coupled SDR family oxidoreductase n=1 Tax=Pseudonocardia abyssalis TaxID=2792008 RepID=A0ABS6UWN5_9PSEU|nr:mycofactocin-coupled SDR family oxidoreductase [Pseudonocardia abyssalis]MBW0114680.1 mycofactocin-coupled SDR family oxidoreductase [Pseudonocardia abyssalis]MBW0136675.1 mycofactocin-coupled SDR family oxidoreductase [Pseudonocardia abyssalis]
MDGKVALITGAARGQGRSHALRLAEEGADIIAVDVCDQLGSVRYPMGRPEDLAETAKLVEELDRRVVTRQADVRDTAALNAAVADGLSEFGHIDVVLANAGIWSQTSTWSMDDAMWDEMIGTNLTGVWKTVRAALPSMIERGAGGSLILTSSTAGMVGFGGMAHYTAAKHGVVGIMRALVQEVSQYDIRVNTVHPTNVDTDMIQNQPMYELFLPDATPEERTKENYAQAFGSMHALQQPWIEARDVSNAIVFLASDDARFITGQQLKIDLGFTEKTG